MENSNQTTRMNKVHLLCLSFLFAFSIFICCLSLSLFFFSVVSHCLEMVTIDKLRWRSASWANKTQRYHSHHKIRFYLAIASSNNSAWTRETEYSLVAKCTTVHRASAKPRISVRNWKIMDHIIYLLIIIITTVHMVPEYQMLLLRSSERWLL